MLLSALQHNKPLYSFEDNADYVYDVMWSPVHPALFACVDGMGRLDLWNLNNDTEVRRRGGPTAAGAGKARAGAGRDLNPLRAGGAAEHPLTTPPRRGSAGGGFPQGAGSPASAAARAPGRGGEGRSRCRGRLTAPLYRPPSLPPPSLPPPRRRCCCSGYLSGTGRAGSGTPGRKPTQIAAVPESPFPLCYFKVQF